MDTDENGVIESTEDSAGNEYVKPVMEAQTPGDPKSLENVFIDCARIMLARIEAWAASEEIPQVQDFHIRFADKSWQYGFEPRSDYWSLVQRHTDELLALQDVVECARQHWTNGGIPPPMMTDAAGIPITTPTFEQVKRYVALHFLFRPTIDAIERCGTFQPTREQVLHSYRRYRKAWSAPSVRWDITIPLSGLTGGTHELPIGERLKLSAFSNDEKTALWSMTFFPFSAGGLDFQSFSQAEFKLTDFYTHSWNGPRSNEEAAAEARDAITTLRLLRAGDVGALAIFERNLDINFPPWAGGIISVPSDFRTRSHSVPYALQDTDVPKVAQLFDSLRKADKQKHRGGLDVALRRFNQSYSREIPEDRIIDLTISLESSLLFGMEDELRYRLAMRGAALLAGIKQPDGTTWNLKDTKALLQLLYDVRSTIVHEGTTLSDIAAANDKKSKLGKLKESVEKLSPVNDLPQRCEDIVRSILRAYVLRAASGQSVADTNKCLDVAILDGLAALGTSSSQPSFS